MPRTEIDQSAPVVCTAVIEIAATPEVVWATLSEVARWPDWNPEILAARLDGTFAVGATIHWQAGGMDIQSRLVRVEPCCQAVWNGTHGAVHAWTLTPKGSGTTLANAESIGDGPAISAPDTMTAQLQAFLERWNALLKARAEAGSHA